MKNMIALLISSGLVALGIFFINQETVEKPSTSISKKIDQDLRVALKQNFFPPAIQSISKIRVTIHTSRPRAARAATPA